MISSMSEQVSQVRTVMGMVQKLKDCHFRTNDLFIEYSSGSHSSLDIKNVRLLLERNGYKSLDIIPANNVCRAIKPIRAVLGQAMKLENWSQPILFRILFPRHPLVDQNHSAAVDSIQLAQIIRLIGELTKPPKQRHLPRRSASGF